jgi:NTE family protein
MAFKIQVALQGGGAKIVALLAAMEGIQRLEKSKQVEVTRVAGTSAGAVVGAMFAAGVDLASARLEFQRIVREEFWSTFKTPSWPGFVSKVMLLKKPLWDGRDLARLLRPFFDRVNVRTLGDIKKRNGVAIHTIASILSEARGTARTSENDPNGDVVSALLDSCALPFCFRIWQSTGNLTVDGGL